MSPVVVSVSSVSSVVSAPQPAPPLSQLAARLSQPAPAPAQEQLRSLLQRPATEQAVSQQQQQQPISTTKVWVPGTRNIATSSTETRSRS